MSNGFSHGTIFVITPRERNQKNQGHAVLTVTTDKGDYVLDNQNQNILLWSETGYRFIKRQSQANPNVWVSLGGEQRTIATATSR